MRIHTEERAFNCVIDAWEFHPGLNKMALSPSKLVDLVRQGVNTLARTDDSLIFKFRGSRYYGTYDCTINGWTFERLRQ